MPEPLPWDSMPDRDEAYVTVDLVVLEAIRELAWLAQTDWHNLPRLRLLLRVARIDQVSGQLVLGLRFVRDLGVEGVPGDSSPGLASQQNAPVHEAQPAQVDPPVRPGRRPARRATNEPG
jgi:hypothetical protein